MEISRYLRTERPNKTGAVLIEMRVCWGGQKIRLSTAERVRPADWNADDEVIRRTDPAHRLKNNRLNTYTNGLVEFFDKRLTAPDTAEVRAEVERIRVEGLKLKPRVRPVEPEPVAPTWPTITEFSAQYIADHRASRSKSWQVSTKAVVDHLTAFRPGLLWPELKINTLNQFRVYLQEELELSDNTLNTYLALLPKFFDYATRQGFPIASDYRWFEGASGCETIRPVMSHANLVSIRQTKLTLPVSASLLTLDDMEQTRWYFLVACATGLRHSDLDKLINPQTVTVNGTTCLSVIQKKTGQKVLIPVLGDMGEMLKNFPGTIQKPLALKLYNTIVKITGEQADLTELVTVGSYYGGELLTDQVRLCDTISSHTARRTFGTLMTEGGLPTRVLQEMMGHKSISSTQRYSNISNDSVILQAAEAWNRSRPNLTP